MRNPRMLDRVALAFAALSAASLLLGATSTAQATPDSGALEQRVDADGWATRPAPPARAKAPEATPAEARRVKKGMTLTKVRKVIHARGHYRRLTTDCGVGTWYMDRSHALLRKRLEVEFLHHEVISKRIVRPDGMLPPTLCVIAIPG